MWKWYMPKELKILLKIKEEIRVRRIRSVTPKMYSRKLVITKRNILSKFKKNNSIVVKTKVWNTHKMISILNVLRSEIPDNIKIHLFQYPDQIENVI
jgi:hypothetical protein